MAFNITTTGTHSPVVFYDLGERSFVHPINNYNLEIEYSQSEIITSIDIQDAIDNGWITVTDANGNSITSTKGVISHSNLSSLTEDDHLSYAKTTGAVRSIFNINSPVNDEVMTYDSASSEWHNKEISTGGVSEYIDCYNEGGTVAIGTSWTDMPIANLRIKTSGFTHSTPEIEVATAGKYVINYKATSIVYSGNSRAQCESRLVLNSGTGYAEVPGSKSELYNRQANFGASAQTPIILDLDVGDLLKVQVIKTQGTSDIIRFGEDCNLVIYNISAKGAKGDTGSAGSGSTINVEDDGVSVPNTPHSTLNFQNMKATDQGSGEVNIKNIFGSEFQQTSSESTSSTTSTSYVQKLLMTTPSLSAGTYRVGWSAEVSNSSTSGCTKVHTKIGSTTIGESMVENEDSRDWQPRSGFYHGTLSGVNNIYIEFAGAYVSCTANIRRARLEIWRVS